MSLLLDTSKLPAHVRLHRFRVSNERPAVNPTIWSDNGKQLHLHVFHFPRFGDINGDGKMEVVFSKGCSEQVTYTLDGREIWRYFQPGLMTFEHAREDSLVPICDLDGDGRAELGAFRLIGWRPHLCVLEAATGKVLHARPYDTNPTTMDTRMSLVPARLDGPGKPMSLVLSRDYWRVETYTHELLPRWANETPDMGHTAWVEDVDGDGFDEVFTGTHLFDASGRLRWAKPELLEGTGETHPDSMLAYDLDGDGRVELALATGAQLLDARGDVLWKRGDRVHHGQAVRLARVDGGKRGLLCFADQFEHDKPNAPRLEWRGRKLRDNVALFHVMNAAGETVGQFQGYHTHQCGDWDGDGNDEIFALAPDRRHINIHRADGSLVDALPIGERVYVSDMVVAPVLPGARGAQLILNEWSEDETETDCVIFENTAAGPRCASADELTLARYTCY